MCVCARADWLEFYLFMSVISVFIHSLSSTVGVPALPEDTEQFALKGGIHQYTMNVNERQTILKPASTG